MPYLESPIAAYEQISRIQPTDFALPTADTEEVLLEPNLQRKGHLSKNIGTTEVMLIYGLRNPEESEEVTELYRIQLPPNAAYLHDFPEVIPYAGISADDDGLIQIIELF